MGELCDALAFALINSHCTLNHQFVFYSGNKIVCSLSKFQITANDSELTGNA